MSAVSPSPYRGSSFRLPARRSGHALGRLAALLATGLVIAQAVAFVVAAPVALAADPEVIGSLNDGKVSGVYQGFNSSNPQDLTAAGTTDWRIWGRTSINLAGDDRKAGGAGISSLTAQEGGTAIPLRALGPLNLGIGTGPSTQPFSMKWTDGTNTPSATGVRTGLQHNNNTSSLLAGYGFQFSVPTSTDPQQLKVWVSAHHGDGRFVASIGDATYADLNVKGGQNQGGIYTIDFTGTGAPGETMSVSWTLARVENPSVLDSSGLPSSEGNAVIYAAALKTTQTAAPAPILVRAATGQQGGILGRVAGVTAPSQDVTFYTASTCSPVAVSQTIGSISLNTSSGAATFAVDVTDLPTSGFVVATAKDATHSTSAYSNCVALAPNNDSWPAALDISTTGGNGGSAPGYTIDQPGQSRWFKFHVAPGQSVQVNLTGLPADYDLVLFTDIAKAYDGLTQTPDLTQLSAQFAGQAFSAQAFSAQAFSAQAFSPQAFSGQAFSAQAFSAQAFSAQAFSAQAFSGQAFSAQAFSGQAFSGQAFSAQAFSAQAFSGQAFSGQAFSAQAFSGQAFSGQAFSGQAFSGQAFSAQAFSAAQVQSVIAVSANGGTTSEGTRSNTWLNDGDFYIRVAGKNGAFDLTDPFTLDVTVTGADCNGVGPIGNAPADSTAQGVKTVILYDSSRIATTATDSGDAATEKQDLLSDLTALANRPEVDGALVDVAGDTRISQLNAQADANTGCPYAKNLVASALKDIVDSYRTNGNPDLQYVVLVGGDAAIPFFRYPDEALLAPESNFAGVGVKSDSPSKASLALNYVLSQDQYGSSVQVAQNATSFPAPDLAVGRLVETASEASGVIDAYLGTTGGTVATPTSSFVSGYDFLSDVATEVQQALAAGIGAGGTNDSLIAPNNISHEDPLSWTATDLHDGLLGSTRHDLVFLSGHFNATSALAADFTSTLSTSDLLGSTTDFTNAIVYSAGCHSGYSFVDPDAVTGVDSVDWAQAFARKGATLIAGTGYQYGDTDFVMYSEQLYKSFTDQLLLGSGPVSVGDALVEAKRDYLSTTPSLRGIDRKALLEATLFGLPMLSVDLPHRVSPTNDTSVVTTAPVATGPGAVLGLRDATVTLDLSDTSPDKLTEHTKQLDTIQDDGTSVPGPTATWYSGPAGVTSKPFEPALPLVDKNVTVAGQTLRGIGFWAGDYADSAVTPLTGTATEEIRGVHATFASPVFYPMRTAEANYFDALADGSTRLLVTPAQHRGDGSVTSTLRLFSNMQFKLFYSNLFGPITGADGKTYNPALSGPPSILDLGAAEAAGNAIKFDTHVVGDPSAGIQQVWVTYTGWNSKWQSLLLTQDPNDSTHWTGSLPIPSGKDATDLRFIEQAASGVGLVALADNFGAYYHVVPFNRQTQTITFATIDDATFGDAQFTISPTASSGLPVDLDASGKCTLSQSTSPAVVTITGGGSCTITASQAGNASFAAAADVNRSFTIAPAAQAIAFAPLAAKTYGVADFAVSAPASSGLTVSFSSTTPAVCGVSGAAGSQQVHLATIGTCTIKAEQAGNANYVAATPATQSFLISQGSLEIRAKNQSKPYGTAFNLGTTEFTVTGLVNSDGVTGVTLTSPGAAATATVAGGPYAITPSNAVGTGLANYVITYRTAPVGLTVTAKALTITANDQGKSYGTAFALGTTAFTTAGLVNGNTVTNVTLTSPGAAAAALVGSYPIVPSAATGTGLGNYAISYVNGTLRVAVPDRYAISKNTTLTVAAPGVLALTSGTATAITVTTKPTGTLTLQPNGSFVYVPKSNFTGVDKFAYRVTIGGVQQPAVTVTIYVFGLGGTNASGWNLAGLDLRGLILKGSNLSSADVRGTNLTGVDLSGSSLSSAKFDGAIADGANLSGSGLSSVSAVGASFIGANFAGSNLGSANFNGANLNNATITGASLTSGKFVGASISRANLSGSNLSKGDFTNANLSFSILTGTNRSNWIVTGANLTGVVY